MLTVTETGVLVFVKIYKYYLKVNLPHMSTRYRRGTRYKSSVATNSTKQTRHDKNGTDQLHTLQEKKCVRLKGVRSFQR